ncbi:MAG: site-specific integrase [Clostridiales bacterium]
MAGTYRKISNKKWELCINIGYDLNGKRIRKYKYIEAKGKREVEELLAEFVSECRKINYSKYGNIKLNEFFPLWMKDYAESSLRKKTISRYKTLWPRVDKALGKFYLSDIRPYHLIQFYNLLKEDGIRLDKKPGGLSPTTIKHHHALLSTVLETAVTWELISSNPCTKVKMSRIGLSNSGMRIKNEESIYTTDQIIELLSVINYAEIKYKLFINLAIFTGARREEILGLEWCDIFYNDNKINILRSSQYTPFDGIYEDELKNKKSQRNCYLPDDIMDILKEYKNWWNNVKRFAEKKDVWKDTNRLFIKQNGSIMHPDTPTKWFNKFLKNNNLPHTTIHKLRHAHGSILLSMGMDMSAVADQMGHADLQMLVSTYLHNMTKNSTDAAKHLNNALLKKRKN